MSRIEFLNSRGLRLVGTLQLRCERSVVIFAHGFTNDKSSNGRFDAIAASLNDVGYGTLAFDFSGCGESDDDSLTAAKQVDDHTVFESRPRGSSSLAVNGSRATFG